MSKVIRLGVILSVATISLFNFNRLVLAETSDVRVGTDSNGRAIMLDVKSMTEKSYKLYQAHDDGIAETTFEPSCAEGRLFTVHLAVYGSTGELIGEDKSSEEMFFKPGSAAAVSLQMYCKAFHARGW
jgi:hypothetical protein